MTVKSTGKKFAQVVNPQINPNSAKQEDWNNISNAVDNTPLFATSHFTKKTSTTGKGKKKKTVTTYKTPYKVTAHDFRLNVPANARVEEVRVVVRMKANKDASESVNPPTFPAVGFYIRDGGKTVRNTSTSNTKGWVNNIYWVESKKKLSKTVASTTYTMSGADFRRGGYTVNDLNSTYCGVDLAFKGEHSNTTVYLMYVYMEVDYTVPDYNIATNYESDANNRWNLQTGKRLNLQFMVGQSSNVKDVQQLMELTLPWGTEIDGRVTDTVNKGNVTSFVLDTSDARKKHWLLQYDGVGMATLNVPIIDYTVDNQEITLKNITSPTPLQPIPDKTFYYHTNLGTVDGYEETTISPDSTSRKRHKTCFIVNTVAFSNDDSITHSISNSHDYTYIDVELDQEASSTGVSLKNPLPQKEVEKDANEKVDIHFTVPSGQKVNLVYRVCIRPHDVGWNTIKVESSDYPNHPHMLSYEVTEPYVYHFGQTQNENEDTVPPEWHEQLINERIDFTNHRIATNLETGAFVLPCHVKDNDSLMIQEKPTLHMYKWEELDYIGCVPLEHLHFDPKSTYKDKLLDSRYKNKRYMGKELASDEDISLNVRLHPHQVTTIQGLIDMDKPIPINANHRCFEGDSLNHRGWAEIYGITTTETNPHWYKCDIDVKYLTHNLNTRFHIEKGDKTFSTYPIPTMFYETNSSGSSINQNNDEDYFTVDTDGQYAYVEDTSEWDDYLDYQGNPVKWVGGYWDNANPPQYHGTELTVEEFDNDEETSSHLVTYKAVKSPTDNTNEIYEYLVSAGETVKEFKVDDYIQVRVDYLTDDVLKNRFALDEGQHISIKTREPISVQNQIGLRWASSKLEENIENAISRITRLIDQDTGDVVFEYEYCDFDFSNFIAYKDMTDETKTESVLSCRVIGRRKHNADYIVEIDEMIDLQSDVETREYQFTDDQQTEPHTELKYFGSNLIFELNGNQLNVIDEGYNGKEIERTLELEGKQYKWETYWENKNTGGENNDIIAYFDLVVQDTVLDSKYAEKYSSMYVSPFPVSNKEILFTRKGEEGIIYYLNDNEEEFTYLIEPYYQYHNGVDLRNSAGSSIFNLNYGYKTIYLENGLVSLGINRLTGKMFLRKYNPVSEEYQTLFNLHLNKYEDININSISDDRIELQASDSTIIMYRGHPYVIFKHELEDIGIDSRSYQVYGQSVDGEKHDYPLYFDLMNKDNLLTDCVTKKLDDDCVNITEHDIEDLNVKTLKIERQGVGDLSEGDTVTLMALDNDGNPFVGRVCYLIKKDDDNGYDEIGCSSTAIFEHELTKGGVYTFIGVYVGDDNNTYAISDEVSVQVDKPSSVLTPPDEQEQGGSDSGSYVLSMSCPSTMYYRDGTEIVFTLTRGGKPVQGETIEITDFSYINTGLTNAQGQVTIRNTYATSHPKKWKIGAMFWKGGNKPITKTQYKTVTVKKATPEFALIHGAGKVGNYFSVNLRDKNHHDKKLNKRKISVKVNNKKINRETNNNGSEHIKIEEKGEHKYVCTFDGDKDYNKCKFTYREKVKGN